MISLVPAENRADLLGHEDARGMISLVPAKNRADRAAVERP